MYHCSTTVPWLGNKGLTDAGKLNPIPMPMAAPAISIACKANRLAKPINAPVIISPVIASKKRTKSEVPVSGTGRAAISAYVIPAARPILTTGTTARSRKTGAVIMKASKRTKMRAASSMVAPATRTSIT